MYNTCVGGFGYLKQDSAGLQVSDLKAYKVDVVNIVLRFTEVPCKQRQTGDTNTDFQAILTCAPLKHRRGATLTSTNNMQSTALD